MKAERSHYRDFDRILLAAALLIFVFGLLSLYSATQAKGLPFSQSYLLRQLSWMAAGLILLTILINISYQTLIDMSYVLYGINVVMLTLVLILGHTRLGAQRWFSIGAFAFQPSEFVKLNLILVLARYIGARREDAASLKGIFIPLFLLALPILLVLAQPDLGTALLLVPIFLSMLLVGGFDMKYLSGLILFGLASIPFLWNFLHGYQKQRLLVFINPNIDPLGAGYTIIQSKIAIGSGGLFGKGWLSGTQNQLNFLPERHTDFIFSVVGEEWGLIGAVVLIFLYYVVVNRGFRIASLTGDIFGKLIATGITAMIAVQVIVNIGMTIGLMPVVGIPLPLVSYGGSSLISTFLAIGLLLNVAMRRSRF